jgi:MFS family permease
VLIFLAAILMSGVVYSAQNGIWPALFGEMFPARVRLSGVAIGTQIGFAIGGLAPTVGTAIAGSGRDGWVPVAALVLGLSVLAAIAIATARETYDKSLAELDGLVEPGGSRAPRTSAGQAQGAAARHKQSTLGVSAS